MTQFNGNEAQGDFAIEILAEEALQQGKNATYLSGFFFSFCFFLSC